MASDARAVSPRFSWCVWSAALVDFGADVRDVNVRLNLIDPEQVAEVGRDNGRRRSTGGQLIGIHSLGGSGQSEHGADQATSNQSG